MELVRSSVPIVSGLLRVTVRSAPATAFSGPGQRSRQVTAGTLAESPKRPFPSKVPTALLPPLPIRLLPGGANQFAGGSCTR